MNQEVWASIPEYPNYEASSFGRIRSVPRVEKYRNRRRKGTMMRQSKNHKGYWTVRLCRDSKERRFSVHGLVLLAFVGARKAGHHGCHNDGNKNNNRLENLRWATPSENNIDKQRHGTIAKGESHGMSRYTEAQARAVKEMILRGIGTTEISRSLGVHVQFVSHIKAGRTWSALAVAIYAQECPDGGERI